MNVRQQIMIGSLRINSITNSSILQIGSTGLIQAYTKDTDEYYTITGQPQVSGQTAAGLGAKDTVEDSAPQDQEETGTDGTKAPGNLL